MTVRLSELAEHSGGHLEGTDMTIATWSTDSRTLSSGAVYFCIRGERFDGHDFVQAAYAKGAAAFVTEMLLDLPTSAQPDSDQACITQLIVPDVRKAFGYLARLWRREKSACVVAVTGSNGKTTLKQMLNSILSTAFSAEAVHATRANDNNEIGVPQTLLGLRSQHSHAVVEIGANLPDEISWCTRLVEPDVALITNVSASHLEGFGTVEDVAREKGHIYQSLSAGGTAIINADDEFAGYWQRLNSSREVLTFGVDAGADVRVLDYRAGQVTLSHRAQQQVVRMSLTGRHNALNAAAATAVALAMGLTLEQSVVGLGKVEPVPGRLNFHSLPHHSTLIDDTYNANPASTRAAIDVLAQANGEKWLVLGDLKELGAGAELFHQQIGNYARDAGVSRLFTTGDLSLVTAKAFGENAQHFAHRDDLVASLCDIRLNKVSVLVKGSRSMQLERVVNALLQQSKSAPRQGVSSR